MKTKRHCKWLIPVLVGVLGSGGSLPAAAVTVGDRRAQVLAELGAPTGDIVMPTCELLYYDRGTVWLREGKVEKADLISAEAWQQRRAEEDQRRAERARVSAARQAQLKAEGEARLKQMLADPSFASTAPSVQVALWRTFMLSYPEVPVTAYFQDALRRAAEQQAQRDEEQRIATLEQRVREAEARVQAAEAAARQAQERSTDYAWPYPTVIYPVTVYPWGGYTVDGSRHGYDHDRHGEGERQGHHLPLNVPTTPANRPAAAPYPWTPSGSQPLPWNTGSQPLPWKGGSSHRSGP